jgi:hypothetical protein
MATHTAQYRLADGSIVSGRVNAIILDEGAIVSYASQYTSVLALGLLVGTANHETNRAQNEIDTDYNDDGSLRLTTYGLYQNSWDDAVRAKKLGAIFAPGAQLTDPDAATQVMCSVYESYFQQLASASGFDTSNPPRDVYAYLYWAHNAGIGNALASIALHANDSNFQNNGMDWSAVTGPSQTSSYILNTLAPAVNSDILPAVDAYPQLSVTGATGQTQRTIVFYFLVGLALYLLVRWLFK